MLDSLDPAAHREPPDYANPGADVRIGALDDDPSRWPTAVSGVDAVCHQAARVGLGVDFDDVERYVHDNDAGTASLLRALWRAGSAAASSWRRRWSSTARGATGARRTASSPRTPLGRPTSRRGGSIPAAPSAASGLAWEPVPEDAPLDPRNVYAATKLHTEHLATAFGRESDTSVMALRYHNVYGPRMPRDSPYAGVASIFRSALEAGRAAAGVRGRRPDARLRARPRRRPGQRAARWTPTVTRSAQRGQR